MKMNRRNVLVGLGGIVASGGALLGTGAFSSVEADRTANFSVANDSGNALLGLEGDGTYVTENSNGVIEFEFTKLNEDAVTVFESVLTATNQTDDGNDKSVYIQESGGVATNGIVNFVVSAGSSNGTGGDSIVGSTNAVTVPDTQSVTLDIEIDSRAGDPSSVSTITIVAESV